MIGFIRKLLKDRRGNALVMAAAALPLLIGAAGLATDSVQWFLWKRQLQRAADSAALAGALARVAGNSYTTAVTRDTNKNLPNFWMGWASGYPSSNAPADTATATNQVQVNLRVQQTLPFSSFFMSTAPLINASATAAALDDGNYCVVALDNSSASGITFQGSSQAYLGCGVISNSVSTTQSVDTTGNAYHLEASPVASVGGLDSTSLSTHGVASTDIQQYHLAEPDPYASKVDTSIPSTLQSSCTNNNYNSHKYNVGTGQNAVAHITPGCFTNFSPGNGITVLDPGVYYLENTSISLTGQQSLSGTGVTIVLTGSSPGTFSMNGNGTVNLTAPTSDPSSQFYKMLLIQSPNATSGNSNLINGDSGSALDGSIYFPKGTVTFTGSSTAATKCLMVVALRVAFQGNTAIQNNTTGCQANTTVKGKKVRLVA